MIESRPLAGIVAGIPIAVLCLGYLLVRRDAVVGAFAGSGGEALSPQAATALAFTTAALIGPLLGLLAGVVYGRMPSEMSYVALAFVLATLLSIAAVALKTPQTTEKVVLNYAVALALGL